MPMKVETKARHRRVPISIALVVINASLFFLLLAGVVRSSHSKEWLSRAFGFSMFVLSMAFLIMIASITVALADSRGSKSGIIDSLRLGLLIWLGLVVFSGLLMFIVEFA